MPITPFHIPFSWLIYSTNRRLSLPALIVGGMIPDIEVPLMWLFAKHLPDHLLLHSLVGALTLGTLLTLVTVRLLYAPLVTLVFGIDRERVNAACEVTPIMVISAAIGVLSHLLLDITMHWYNPILWPWTDPFLIVGPLVLLFMGLGLSVTVSYFIANITITLVMGILFLAEVYMNRGPDLWSRLFVR